MSRVAKQMVQPVSAVFDMLKVHERVQIWLYEQTAMRMEGILKGFDEFMNVVLDDAEEVDMKTGARKRLGRTLLKGDNITLIMKASAAVSTASAVAEAAPAAASSSSSSSAAASH